MNKDKRVMLKMLGHADEIDSVALDIETNYLTQSTHAGATRTTAPHEVKRLRKIAEDIRIEVTGHGTGKE